MVFLLLLQTALATEPIHAVVVHPPFAESFTCTEHPDGQLKHPGDALGSDCVIERFVVDGSRGWMRAYMGDGSKNENWFGWGQKVLAPLSGEVVAIGINDTVNTPGTMGKPPASAITIQGPDGVRVLVAHVRDVAVSVGDPIDAGEVIGVVGNNGMSRHPHIHIGAWKGEEPLQLRFDLKARKPANMQDGTPVR